MQRILVFMFLISSLAYGSIGMGDWSARTPYGNEVRKTDTNDGIVLFFDTAGMASPVKRLSRWYFFDGNIVGEVKSINPRYFVAEESTGTVQYFNDENSWKIFLTQNNLIPSFKTRWYSSNWLFFGDDFKFVALMLFPLSLAFVILLLSLIKKALSELLSESESYRYRAVAVMVFVCILFLWMSDVYPQSF